MAPQFGCYQHHSDEIRCRKCGQAGAIIWEEISRQDRTLKELLRIEGDFFERIAKKPPHPIELVCTGCGTPQVSSLQP